MKIEKVVEKDKIKQNLYYKEKPIDELIKYKNIWQKLKEWLEQDIQDNLDSENELVQHAIEVEQWVLDKMQELGSSL